MSMRNKEFRDEMCSRVKGTKKIANLEKMYPDFESNISRHIADEWKKAKNRR